MTDETNRIEVVASLGGGHKELCRLFVLMNSFLNDLVVISSVSKAIGDFNLFEKNELKELLCKNMYTLFSSKVHATTFQKLADIVVEEFFTGGREFVSERPFYVRLARPEIVEMFTVTEDGTSFSLPFDNNAIASNSALIPKNITGVSIECNDPSTGIFIFVFYFNNPTLSLVQINERELDTLTKLVSRHGFDISTMISHSLHILLKRSENDEFLYIS